MMGSGRRPPGRRFSLLAPDLIAFVPVFQGLLKTTSLTGAEWILATGAALIGSFWLEARKLLAARSR